MFVMVLAAVVSTSPQCAKLASDYEDASKLLAISFASIRGDDSAITDATRETHENGIIEKSRVTLDLMKGAQCKLPIEAPNAKFYLHQAMQCAIDELKQGLGTVLFTGSCDSSKWKREN